MELGNATWKIKKAKMGTVLQPCLIEMNGAGENKEYDQNHRAHFSTTSFQSRKLLCLMP
jgi:hypothetical protein